MVPDVGGSLGGSDRGIHDQLFTDLWTQTGNQKTEFDGHLTNEIILLDLERSSNHAACEGYFCVRIYQQMLVEVAGQPKSRFLKLSATCLKRSS